MVVPGGKLRQILYTTRHSSGYFIDNIRNRGDRNLGEDFQMVAQITLALLPSTCKAGRAALTASKFLYFKYFGVYIQVIISIYPKK